MISICKSREGNIYNNAMCMIFISIFLFWLPIIGAFIAGVIGSKKAISNQQAIYSALLAGTLMGIIMFFLAANLSALPILGAIARAGSLYLALSFILPLLLGAKIGGLYEK